MGIAQDGTGIVGRSIRAGQIQPYHLADGFRKQRYFYERFGPIASILQYGTQTAPVSVPTLPTAVQDNVARIVTGMGNMIELYSTTAQTLLPVPHATKGWDLAMDAVDNESFEMVPGGNSALSPLAFVTGTDGNFFISVTLELTDASGSDQLLIGFRKVEPYIVPTSFLTTGDGIYTDFYGVGFAATKANPNPVNVASDVANSGSTTVSPVGFTWADTKKHKVEVWVVGRVPRVFVNGVALGGSVSKDAAGAAITAQSTKSAHAYTFGTALTLVPWIFYRHDADVSEAAYISECEVGLLEAKGQDPAQRGA